MKNWSVKQQLYIVASIPALVVLVALMFFFYTVFEKMYSENASRNREVLTSVVPSYLQISNKPIHYLHEKYDKDLFEQSKVWRNALAEIAEPHYIDLQKKRTELFTGNNLPDIYLVNFDGTVINTTFAPDSGLNIFKYGVEHRSVYQRVMRSDTFWTFSPLREKHSGRYRLFSYMPDERKRFMIELGQYTPEIESIVQYINENTQTVVDVYPEIKDVSILFGNKEVAYLNNKHAEPTDEEAEIFRKVVANKEAVVIDEGDEEKHFVYLSKNELSQLSETVLVLTYDKTVAAKHLQELLKKSMIVVALLIFVVFISVLYNSKWFVKPITNLVDVVRHIESGDLNSRAKEKGSEEVRFLANRINNMAEQIQESYHRLEQKVNERTETINQKSKELEEQKHELEQQNSHLNEAFQQIEHQKQDIVSGIKAAERLQRIILPKETDLFHLLNATFIINLPKDYVSGDFYWATEIDGKSIVALGDCTGHGVSGAILSILGNEIFNKAVKANNLVEPDQILNAVDEGLKLMLNHKSSLHYKDGMDLSVCVIDKENMLMEYAVANSRMYLARDKEVTELKGDKNSIGDDYIARSTQKFKKYTIELKKRDMIYLTSDGFADQFGGENNKKFTRKKLRNLLSTMSAKPITLQKLIAVSQFEDWKGQNFQVDDVLMIGIRI